MQQTSEFGKNKENGKKPKKPSISAGQAKYEQAKSRHLAENPGLSDLPTVLRNPFEEKTVLYPTSPEIVELSPEDVVTYVSKVVQEKAQRAGTVQREQVGDYPEIEYWVDPDNQDITTDQSTSSPRIDVRYEELDEEIEIDLSEFEDLSLEEFLKKDQLTDKDAYLLNDFLKKDPQNIKLWEFIQKIAPRQIDYDLFWQNFDLLSPIFIQALLVNGSFTETTLDKVTNKEKRVYLVSLDKLTQGGVGLITKSYYCEEDNLKLEPVLVKTALGDFSSQQAFDDELEMAQRIKVAVELNPDDPRTKHILSPKHIGRNFIVMPILHFANHIAAPLNKVKTISPNATKHWAKQLSGAMQGNAFLTENGIINIDFKPGNILLGNDGGILIDWGGFIEKSTIRGGMDISGNPADMSMYPFLSKETQPGTFNQYIVPHTPSYGSLHLTAMEIQNQISAGSTHKFTLCRILEKFLVKRHHIDSAPSFNLLDELDKLYAEPISLNPEDLSAADQLLYQLYLKLHQAHFHPYRFHDDNVKKGLDPEYISNLEIVVALQEIANLKD